MYSQYIAHFRGTAGYGFYRSHKIIFIQLKSMYDGKLLTMTTSKLKMNYALFLITPEDRMTGGPEHFDCTDIQSIYRPI